MSIFIIAEAGVNHNGDREIAKQLVDAAADAGCDAVKFQTYKTEKLVTADAEQAEYQQENLGTAGESQFAMLKRYEFGEGDFLDLARYAESRGIEFMSTPFDDESVELLERVGVHRYKLSSGDLTNKPLIERVARTGKPIILSTGMATIEEVGEALEWCKACGNDEVSLLHCTSAYPTSYGDVNMLAMKTLSESFDVPVGYSDHTMGIEIPIMAAALGAQVIEKHITLSRDMEGPDHKASLEVVQLPDLVQGVRHVEQAFGRSSKVPTEAELQTAKLVRKSVVSVRHLSAGAVVQLHDLAVKRPADGIAPKHLLDVVGKRVLCDIEPDTPIQWKDVSDEQL